MGKMNFVNNGKPSWDLIVDSTARAKNSGCFARSPWVGMSNIVTAKTNGDHFSYSKTGNLGKVECQVACSAEATQYMLDTSKPKNLQLWEAAFGKDARHLFWDITRCQIYVPPRSLSITGPYRLNARVKSVKALNFGQGDMNWGGILAQYKIEWSGMGSTETHDGTVRVYANRSGVQISVT